MYTGRLEVVCGSMFSGKSEELIRRLRRAEFARLSVQVFKHSLDGERSSINHLHAHSGATIAAQAVSSAGQIRESLATGVQVVGIDEIQFFDADIVSVVLELVESRCRVIVAGLDVDFRTYPFGSMPALMAIADDVLKLKAVCMVCGDDARFTQRLVDGKPAQKDDPLVLIGATECYQARCRTCHEIG